MMSMTAAVDRSSIAKTDVFARGDGPPALHFACELS
jgi:hypothetical protein